MERIDKIAIDVWVRGNFVIAVSTCGASGGRNASIEYIDRRASDADGDQMLICDTSLFGGSAGAVNSIGYGSWVELNKEPGQSSLSGFPHAMYKTDAQQQMLEGVLQTSKRFGAGLPPPEDPHIDYHRVINYDRSCGDSTWAAITSTEFVSPSTAHEKCKEFCSKRERTGGISDPAKLKQYRDRWTVEADSVRPVRFKTDSVVSANSGVPPKFQRVQTRKIPGAPMAVDRLRAKVLQGDKMGFVKLRRGLLEAIEGPMGALQVAQIEEGLRRSGVTISDADLAKIFDFFSSSGTTEVNVREFVSTLRGHLTECRRKVVEEAFPAPGEGDEAFILTDELKEHVRASREERAMDVTGSNTWEHETLIQNASLYQEGDRVTVSGLQDFFGDAFHDMKTDAEFAAIVMRVLGIGSCVEHAEARIIY